MNVEQQQQQQHSMLPPPPPALLTAKEYAGYSVTNCDALQSVSTSQPTTYVPMVMLQPTGATIEATIPSTLTTVTTVPTSGMTLTTSTFKTQLLPMPSLEDIEDSLIPNTHTQPIPGGILKYPTSMLPLDISMEMGPGPPILTNMPPPPISSVSTLASSSSTHPTEVQTHLTLNQMLHEQPPTPATLTLNEASACHAGTLQSNAKLLCTTSSPPMLPLSAVSSSVAKTIAAGSNKCNSTASKNSNTGNNNNNANNRIPPNNESKGGCCSCFSSGNTKSSYTQSTTTSKEKRKSKQSAQTLWSALFTNLGICALLVAYTLLGSFIFLTIESEDSLLLHTQHTLASTKRVGVSGRDLRGGNIYHNQQQQQLQRLDNGTIVGIDLSPATSPGSSQSMPEGVVTFGATNDMVYSEETTSQWALSADTYDVRQRTIENIWDITVSLNILYKENWTKLAALEIAKFQDQLIKRLNEDALLQLSHDNEGNRGGNSPATEAVLLHTHRHGHHDAHEWNFAKAFLYSLTVLTTIGYGNIAPRTTLGRLATLIYAIFGIPLTLVYLSSTGGILAKIAREVFSKALCCCLCSNCGYCCYDEKRMAEKERRTKRKRQQIELKKQQASLQEPFYVRSGSMPDAFQTPEKQAGQIPDLDSLSASESRGSMHGLSILAPILLCLSMMIIYIIFGAIVLYRLENWPLVDGIYFCFMSLSTIGFGDMLPGLQHESTTTIWFCSIYIMSGMALTAMCFNVIHEEIVHRIKLVVEFKKESTLETTNEEHGYYVPP